MKLVKLRDFSPIDLVGIITASIVMGLLLNKTFTTADIGWDTLAYHKPFAARLVGICDVSCFQMGRVLEARYQGFPVLVELLQGLIWKLTGRPEHGNLVNYLALVILVSYLHISWRVSWYWSVLALLAIPHVLTQVASEFIDLVGNIAITLSCLVLLKIAIRPQEISKSSLFLMALSMAFAANTKILLIPVVAVLFVLAVVVAIAERNGRVKLAFTPSKFFWPMFLIATAVLCGVTVARNLIEFGNPVYPVQLDVFGWILPGVEGSIASGPDYLRPYPTPVRWLVSVLEIHALDGRPLPYLIGMGDVPMGSPASFQGGYNVAYVLAVITSLFIAVKSMERRARTLVAVGLIGMTLFVSVLPNANELRYYMFWMIVLVSVALILFTGASGEYTRLFKGLILIFFASVTLWTGGDHLKQQGKYKSLIRSTHIDTTVAGFSDGGRVCIPYVGPMGFLYSTAFHSGRHYSVIMDGRDNCSINLP